MDIYWQICHFKHNYRQFMARFIKKALKVSKCNFSERTTSYELSAIVLVLWNFAHIKRCPLVLDQTKWSQWPFKMAIGHFPNGSHNFAWRGIINHDWKTTLTLQTKYDTTLPSGYPKVAYPLEISIWIRNLLIHGSHFSDASLQQWCTTSLLFTMTSSQGHVNHVITIMTHLSFTKFWNLYCSRTMHFS